MKHISKTSSLLLLGVSLSLALPASAEEANAKALIEGKYAVIQEIVRTDKTDEGVREKVTGVLESFTDFEVFSQRTLKKYWPGLSVEQKKLFVTTYRQLIHKTYIKHFKANKTLDVAMRGEPVIKGTKALVRTTVKSGKTESDVDYKLLNREETYFAYDIIIDDVSLTRSYRKQFGHIMKKDGFKTLIDKMTQKIEKGEGDIEDI